MAPQGQGDGSQAIQVERRRRRNRTRAPQRLTVQCSRAKDSPEASERQVPAAKSGVQPQRRLRQAEWSKAIFPIFLSSISISFQLKVVTFKSCLIQSCLNCPAPAEIAKRLPNRQTHMFCQRSRCTREALNGGKASNRRYIRRQRNVKRERADSFTFAGARLPARLEPALQIRKER